MFGITFILNSILLGIGLAMDAFSVSLANALNNPYMTTKVKLKIAGTFALFQFGMPLAGWFLVHTIVDYFKSFQKVIPWIALILLLFIGGEMLLKAILEDTEEKRQDDIMLSSKKLLIQGVATSIDALSVGFTIANYGFVMAFLCSVIIAVVTFAICMAGLKIGAHFGLKLSNKASLLGGIILIFIGIEIFIKGLFF